MQLSVIEFARNVCHLDKANSTEFDPTTIEPIIDLMNDQKSIVNMGGTLRLGNYECKVLKDTLAYKDYGSEMILERHRHRYEFNNKYRNILEENGINNAREQVEKINSKCVNDWKFDVRYFLLHSGDKHLVQPTGL